MASSVRANRLELCESRIAKLEERNRALTAQMLKAYGRTGAARRALDVERGLRLEAERNTDRFHALLIAERIRKVPT